MTAPEKIETTDGKLRIWRNGPALNGARTAALGAFDCKTAKDGAVLLNAATALLKTEGFEAVVGPMDGDTWSMHRLVTQSDGSAAFPFEPHNPSYYPDAFNRSGFDVVARYVSAIAPSEAFLEKQTPIPEITVRTFDPSTAEETLIRVHKFALEAFSRNVFYKPISVDRFLGLYLPILHLLDPNLVLFAENKMGELKGFVFAMPNFGEGEKPRSAIVKTLASSQRGVGSLLVNRTHQNIRRLGFERVIHALMHEDNPSYRLSNRFDGRIFRRYALWGKTL